MKKALIAMSIVLALSSATAFPDREKQDFATYQEMRKHLGGLFKEKRFEEAAALLEGVLDRFPDNLTANTYNLALARLYQGDAEKALEALEEGHRRGIFFGIWDFTAELWDPVKILPRFEIFLIENQARVDNAQAKASMTLDVVMPEEFDPSRRYPLFIALHGGGESAAGFKPSWTSPRLRGEFITAYVQSSQVADMKGFHWNDVEITRRDLIAAHSRILERYPVDAGRAVIGGFSSGGYGSLIAALKDFFPVRGFVVLCPAVPDMIEDEDILGAASRGLRGSLLTTEGDGRVAQQQALFGRLEQAGLAVDIHLTPDIGHWYPKDFESLLDRALEFILEPEKAAAENAGAADAASILQAAQAGDLETVARLLKQRPNLVEAKIPDGETVLHQAAGGRGGEETALPIVRLLLERGAAVEARNANEQTPLLYAAYGGSRRIAELLIDKGAVVQYRDTHGRSPLHYAAREGHPAVVDILLKNGADPFARDNQNRSPLEYAVLQNRPAVVETLMTHVRYDIKGPDGSILLHAAAAQGHDGLVKSLLEQGADPNRSAPGGETILISYLRGGLDARAVEAIAGGADLSVHDSSGRTALHTAVENGAVRVVSALLERGADPNATDKNGLTPIAIAEEWGEPSLVDLLASKGARASRRRAHILKDGSFEIADLPPGTNGETAVIRYIGTDGFLIEAGSRSVLVDGLVSNPWGYPNTPARALAKMKATEAPFARLDLLLFSHAHRDHFEPNMALAVLAAQKEAVLVGDGIVAKEIREAGPDAADALSARIAIPDTGIGERTEMTVNGIPLTVLGVNHAPAERPYLTLGFIMRMGDFTIYHQGDLFPDANLPFLASIPWEKERIDIAFFDPFFFQNEEARRIVRERIRPSAVILMHMRDGEAEGYLSRIRPGVPQVLAFERPMESKVFVKPTALD